MTGNRSHPSSSSALWVKNGIIWVALLALLLLSMFLAYIPMGPITVASGVIVAVIKSSLVVVFFMELIQARALVRLAAVSGLIFLAAMFLLTFADVLTRTGKI
jgi:cytochrome c oxidase subunit IV